MDIRIKISRVCMFESMLVSSAKSIGTDLLFINLGRSLMYSRKSKGPKMEPCGTPCLISHQFESVVLLCFLLFTDTL
jgi:hypothetical protein